ncbi:coiled-coil domain-containing protein 80 precursor-like [Scleropages formosus]|uniref:Coiled-coil domain-containing protein 80 n=1 Tax=Scleropages formosus TaxID=113540 RepID=A0A0P7UYR3_SCLFO|nr:coiled-coil domain-containing protein 80 precursor-like [Scleropages formosus]
MRWALVLRAALLLASLVADTWESGATDRGEERRQLSVHRGSSRVATPSSGAQTWAGGRGHSKAAVSSSGDRVRPGEQQVGQRSAADGQSRKAPGRRKPSHRRRTGWHEMVQDEAAIGMQPRQTQTPGSGRFPSLLASFAGRNRVLVISAPHDSDGYYRLMMSLLKPDIYCELAERHMQQIVMFHQEGEMGGKVRRINNEGQIIEEPLDTLLIPRLMNFLKLDKGKFGMVLLRKTLQVEERYPYPVRLEAMYEVIDKAPMRKVEKIRQKGFVQKCKEAGVEGQIVKSGRTETPHSNPQVDTQNEKRPQRKPIRRPSQSTSTPTISSTTRVPATTATTTTTTTRRPTTTTTTTTATTTTTTTTAPPTTTTLPTTTATTLAATQHPTKAQMLLHWVPDHRTTADGNHPHTSLYSTPPSTKAYTGRNGDSQTRRNYNQRNAGGTIIKPEPSTKAKQPKNTNLRKEVSNEHEDTYKESAIAGDLDETEIEVIPPKKGKNKQDKAEKKKKAQKMEKTVKREKMERKAKAPKDRKGESRNRKTDKQTPSNQDREDAERPSKKVTPSKGSLASFIDYFEGRRRLLLITTPSEDHKMYTQQRDEYLEYVCEMAVRKLSIITIFGTFTNSTMKIDHYQLEHDKPMKGLRREDLVDQDLITQLRKGFGMTDEDFFMVLTDFDMKAKQYYEVPIAMKGMFDYIDTFNSRISEMEQQRREGVMCKKEDKPRSLENFLSRFRWRRRLFIISAPNDEEWAYQQQLQALSGQACSLGSATVEREGLPASLVKDIRNYFQISPEYFSMLLVGKDGNVKSWYPSPMWSMAIIYDMVDSMQLRRQEMAIQQSLGMRCPEEEYGGYGYHNQGYHGGYQEGYHQGYGY